MTNLPHLTPPTPSTAHPSTRSVRHTHDSGSSVEKQQQQQQQTLFK